MRTSRTPIVFGLVIVTIVALFFWWRTRLHEEEHLEQPDDTNREISEKISPPRTDVTGARLSEWARRLAARNGATDLPSTVETFKESGNCLQYFIALHEIAFIQSNERPNEPSRESATNIDSMNASLRRSQALLDQTEAFCSGANEEYVARTYMISVLNAALKGDADAQSCFVITGSVIPSPKTMLSGRYTKYLESRYLKHAPSFTQSALERADPYVAENAIYKYIESPSLHPSQLDTLPLPDPYLTLRTARLASLRALPEQRASLEKSIATFEKLDLLSPNEIKRADDWAEAAYARDFINTPKLDLSRFTPCHSLKEPTP